MKSSLFIIFFAVVFCIFSCGKKGDTDTGSGAGSHFGSGSIYYDWSEGQGLAIVYKLDLNSAVRSKELAYNSDRHAWDISRDGSRMIQSVADPADYDGEIYRI